MSPLLFIAYMERVIRDFKAEWRERRRSGVLAYADDIAFWGVEGEDMEEGMNIWNRCFRRAGMKINIEKTVRMEISRRRAEGMRIEIEGERVKTVESFKYLGSVFERDGGMEGDVRVRMARFGGGVRACGPLLRDENVPLKVKKIIYETVLVPVMTYGAECWTTTTASRSRIQAAEMRPLRAMIGKSRRDRVRNEYVRNRIGVSPMIKIIERSQLRWLGHLERMEEGRMARRWWVWRPEGGRRPRGRPRKRWRDEVEGVLERNGLPELEELRRSEDFQDREEWRKRLRQLTGD